MSSLINKIENPVLSKEKSIEKEKDLIHETEKQVEQVELYRCDICNQEFATEKELKIYKTKKHPNKSQTIESHQSEEK